MKIGLFIASYNRPQYLRQCLASVKAADLSQVGTILICDDCSTDKETIQLINDFEVDGVELIKAFSKQNRSVKGSLLFGCDLLFNTCDIVMNLDGDAVVRKDFVEVLIDLKKRFPEHIITGFNCLTRNRDGSERHKVLGEGEGFNLKASVGGINMLFDKAQYEKWVRPALVRCLATQGNWDHQSCIASMKDGKEIVCAVPSVVQHIGIGKGNSSMGHALSEPPDTAEDFFDDFANMARENAKQFNELMKVPLMPFEKLPSMRLQLPNVTLICADGVNVERCIHAANISCRDIEFGAVKILSHLPSDDPRVIKIRPIADKKDYSQFILKEIVNYVDTDFLMIFQFDGFPINTKAWDDEFLKWSMVGAPWKFKKEKRTANGGFSLRSRKMCEAIRDDDAIYLQNDNIITNFAEDHVLFHIYREYLETNHGVKIAPEEICDKFSIEAWGEKPPLNKYNGSFGFHGFSVDFNDADLPYIPYKLPNREIL